MSVLVTVLYLAACFLFATAADNDAADNVQIEDGDVEALIRKLYQSPSTDASNGQCTCVQNNCGCCERVVVKKIKLDANACANVTYLPDQYGINLAVTINGYSLLNMTVSAKSPPPLCIGIPFVQKAASVCVDLYNMAMVNHSFVGCIKLDVYIATFSVKTIQLGCFRIPLPFNQRPRADLLELIELLRRRDSLDASRL